METIVHIPVVFKVGWKMDVVVADSPVLPVSGWMGAVLLKISDNLLRWKGRMVFVDSTEFRTDTLVISLVGLWRDLWSRSGVRCLRNAFYEVQLLTGFLLFPVVLQRQVSTWRLQVLGRSLATIKVAGVSAAEHRQADGGLVGPSPAMGCCRGAPSPAGSAKLSGAISTGTGPELGAVGTATMAANINTCSSLFLLSGINYRLEFQSRWRHGI